VKGCAGYGGGHAYTINFSTRVFLTLARTTSAHFSSGRNSRSSAGNKSTCATIQPSGGMPLSVQAPAIRLAAARRSFRCLVVSGTALTGLQLWNYENDCGEPPSSAIAKLCLLYGVSIQSLVNADEKTLQKMYIAA